MKTMVVPVKTLKTMAFGIPGRSRSPNLTSATFLDEKTNQQPTLMGLKVPRRGFEADCMKRSEPAGAMPTGTTRTKAKEER